MTPETYCPECKQNVPKGASCANCGYEFVNPGEELGRTINQIGLWYCSKCETVRQIPICEHEQRCVGRLASDLSLIPRAELEELVGAYEVMITIAGELAARLCIPARDEFVKARSAKFRTKYLDGK